MYMYLYIYMDIQMCILCICICINRGRPHLRNTYRITKIFHEYNTEDANVAKREIFHV